MSDFWTRRRAAVEAEEQAREAALDRAEAEAREAELAERSDADLLAEAGLPEPEALEDRAQVRAFLQSALPQRLKARALRRLWRLDPVLANVDGLVDYGGDYTDAATVIKDMKSAYQVGKGMLARWEAFEAAEAERVANLPDASEAEPAAEEDALEEIAAAPEPPAAEAPRNAPASDPAPRRMRFRFDTAT